MTAAGVDTRSKSAARIRKPLHLVAGSLFGIAVASIAFAGEAPLVALRLIDPSIHQDMRYAGPDNFTGRRVPGYESGECWLRPAAARALAKVEAELAKASPPLALLVFDCYRPKRAVAAFMEWAAAPDDGRTRHYHPNLARRSLVSLGYIGRNSTHSRGIAVDLTIIRKDGGDVPAKRTSTVSSAAARTACTDASDQDRNPAAFDMGTSFDCFDPKSNTEHASLDLDQHHARQTLKRVMRRHGFENYAKEWWHYTFPAADDGRAFDMPVGKPAEAPVDVPK